MTGPWREHGGFFAGHKPMQTGLKGYMCNYFNKTL